MATKSAGEFRNGMTLEIDGKVCQVMEFMHVKPGKGAAFVRVKLKDIINGGVVETTFRPTESFQEAFIERKKMQYLYNDGDLFYFMDNETFDQIAVSAGEAVCDRAAAYRRTAGNRDRAWIQGQHRTGRYKAGYRGDRSAGFCSAVCRPGRDDQDRHPYRRIPVQSIRDAAPSGVLHISIRHERKSLAFFAGLFYNDPIYSKCAGASAGLSDISVRLICREFHKRQELQQRKEYYDL